MWIAHFILRTPSVRAPSLFPFTAGETEAQRVTCPRSNNWQVSEPGFEPRQCSSRACAHNHYGTLSLMHVSWFQRDGCVLLFFWELLLSPNSMWLWTGWICPLPYPQPQKWAHVTQNNQAESTSEIYSIEARKKLSLSSLGLRAARLWLQSGEGPCTSLYGGIKKCLEQRGQRWTGAKMRDE